MGAAASSGSDTTPADDLAASFESWVTSGGDRCAAALAALEAASPALAAALRSADADAVRGALAAPAATEDGAEANADSEAPTTKRYKPSENSGAAFVRVVLKIDGNASKVLNFAGYRTLLRLEEVCKPARNALRAAKLELDVTKVKQPILAVAHARRDEILEARRQGYFPPKGDYTVRWRFSGAGAHQSTADVLYRGDRVLLTSPRPPQLFRAASGLDTRDQERSKASLAAHQRSRAALLAVGCVMVDVDHRRGNLDEARTRKDFWRTVTVEFQPDTTTEVGEAQVAALVETMGGARAVPRRLVLAAGRQKGPGAPVHAGLRRAFRFAADKSAVLGVDQLERLTSAAWRAQGLGGLKDITEDVFLGACADAHISDSDAAVAWREACSGVLLPFEPKVKGFDLDAGATDYREPGDVLPGDVNIVDFASWLVPAVISVSLTLITNGVYRDPAQLFSARDCYVLDLTFEHLVLRMQEGECWALCILNELAFQRDGEENDEPGRARVAEAIASLLTPDRVATLAVGSAVEYGSGAPVAAWVSASVVELSMETMMAKIRVEGEAEPKTVGIGALRLVEQRPSAAAIVLAHAVKHHRNDIVVQLLASPLMVAPLQFVVGAPNKEMTHARDGARATALDYAISSRNVVAVGLLSRNYVNTWDAWSSVLSTHSTSDINSKAMPPRVRGDLFCALRVAPQFFRSHLNAWWQLMVNKTDGIDKIVDQLLSGDMARVRSLVLQFNKIANRKAGLELMLSHAAKMGQVDVISEILSQTETVLDITASVRVAIVEGQTDCLERLLRAGPSLFPFVSAYTPDSNISARHLCVLLDAVHLNDEAAIDLLRSRGVRLGPFTGADDEVIASAQIKFHGGAPTRPLWVSH